MLDKLKSVCSIIKINSELCDNWPQGVRGFLSCRVEQSPGWSSRSQHQSSQKKLETYLFNTPTWLSNYCLVIHLIIFLTHNLFHHSTLSCELLAAFETFFEKLLIIIIIMNSVSQRSENQPTDPSTGNTFQQLGDLCLRKLILKMKPIWINLKKKREWKQLSSGVTMGLQLRGQRQKRYKKGPYSSHIGRHGGLGPIFEILHEGPEIWSYATTVKLEFK